MMMVMAMVVTMSMVMVVRVSVAMPMTIIMCVVSRFLIQPTRARAKIIAQGTIRHVGARRTRALPFYMMVVALLDGTDFAFKPQNLRAIFAQGTIRRRDFAQLLTNPLDKRLQNFWMVAQISRLYKLQIGVFRRANIGETINPINQNARE